MRVSDYILSYILTIIVGSFFLSILLGAKHSDISAVLALFLMCITSSFLYSIIGAIFSGAIIFSENKLSLKRILIVQLIFSVLTTFIAVPIYINNDPSFILGMGFYYTVLGLIFSWILFEKNR